MAYDEFLADRIRRVLAERTDVTERHMFGGVAFMVRGHMCCGLAKERLMIRVDPAEYEDLLAEPHAAVMDFTGRPMRGFLYVDPEGLADAAALRRWLAPALRFAERQPARPVRRPKAGRTRTARRRARSG